MFYIYYECYIEFPTIYKLSFAMSGYAQTFVSFFRFNLDNFHPNNNRTSGDRKSEGPPVCCFLD